VPTVSLPDNPSLDNLRRLARLLQRRVRAGDPEAVAMVATHHPDGAPGGLTTFQLSAAQLVVARRCGFASWPRLKRYLDVVAQHGWNASPPEDSATALPDEFCRLACLAYTEDDGPERWARARQLLADHPDLTDRSIWAAAAATRAETVQRLLAADPELARLRGGPHRWRPLFYLAYSRVDPDAPLDAVLRVAELLLTAGADPNEGYLWNAQPYLFTLLTGAFGNGELGPVRQPPHAHSLALARLLLAAGADPNDGQTLYNRMFARNDDHLVLLFEFGLGRGNGGVWKARIGEHVDSPTEMLRTQLRWAIEHDQADRVRLLVEHGVDFRSPYRDEDRPVWQPGDGRTPADLAQLNGNTAILEYLVSRGAAAPRLDRASDLVAAAFRADRLAVERMRARHPDLVDQVRQARPGLIVWAAAQGRTETVALLAELGFDVDALGRGDAPVEQGWETALHQAAYRGDLELARLLLGWGADTGVRDARFDATPLDWARHFDRQAIVELLSQPSVAT
jgi:Ankyrin repeats (many copies)